jgi:hypothetical protein
LPCAQNQHQVHHGTNVQEGWHMPQSNDAELTDAFTSETGEVVADNEPNSGPPGGPAAATFDLHLQLVAGNVIGNSAANYTVRADCIDETLAAPNASMSLAPDNQQFNAANGWVASGTNFVKEQVNTITVDPAAGGHVLRYVASLVSVNGDIASFYESPLFILITP